MASLTRSFFVFLWLLVSPLRAEESAWNGHTTPGSTVPTRFAPYYVPLGAKSYDSSSPLIHYAGDWFESYSPAFVHKTLRGTGQRGASVKFTFTGTGIEWFGNSDRRHAIAKVYIDGKFMQDVDAYSNEKRVQQRIYWKYDLDHGRHMIKIVCSGRGRRHEEHAICDVDAFVVTRGPDPEKLQARPSPGPGVRPFLLEAQLDSPSQSWTLTQKGSTGVSAMQLAVISQTHAIIIDKVEHNPLSIDGHPAWAALFNFQTLAVRPLRMKSNSFCAGGTFLGNGTLINVGGNPVVEDHTNSADFGDEDGLQAVRVFEPCDSDSADGCVMYENHSRLRMASPRWYNTVLRLDDGSAMIIGGSKRGGWNNNQTVNNPTIEFFPPKSIHGSNSLPIHLQFLVDTLNANLFPIAFTLPDGKVFMSANQDAMIYDWKSNTERRLPRIPNGVRVTYPMAGVGLLLPLSPENGYAPEILLCGGSTIDDTKPSWEISSQDPASDQCSRLLLTEDGIAAGWQTEHMPEARTMHDAVLLPDGQVVIVNGAGSGISGYGNVPDQVGQSNADNPTLTPVLYNPFAPTGQRFSTVGMPTTQIPRLYHSVATLVPDGNIMIAGSNPNLDRSEVKYGTEYRVEWLSPPYMKAEHRPKILEHADKLEFGQTITVKVENLGDAGSRVQGERTYFRRPLQNISDDQNPVALMDFGFVTHAVHANSRLVYLEAAREGDSVRVTGPPNGGVYPPGPGWIFVLVNSIPSSGVKVIVGDGSGPPVDHQALESLLRNTKADQYEEAKKSGSEVEGSE